MLTAAIETELRDFELAFELEVGAGECVALVGRSGAGKSTVLRSIAGLHRPDRGRIEAAGAVWFDSAAGADLAVERRRCGYLFQEYALFPHLSAWRNVAFGLVGGPRSQRRDRALALLERFGVAELADERPAEVSGGERQRIALARALATDPAVLLLDEPLASLDATTAASAGRELGRTLAELTVPTVLVTHNFAEAALLAGEIAVIERGRAVQRGTAGELSARPASAFVADFAGATVLTGHARRGADGLTEVAIDGGGSITSTDAAEGPVSVAIYPWEVALEPLAEHVETSARNRLEAVVASVTEIGNRARVGLLTPQPLAAEITVASVAELALAPGARVAAVAKATATRLIER